MSLPSEKSLSALLDERRTFPPSEKFKRQANWNDPAIYGHAAEDPESFWAEQAKNLDWFKPCERVLEWNAPWAKWFVGGKLNVRTTAWTGMRVPRDETRQRLSGRANLATRAC